MIGKLKGVVDEVGEEELILDVGGVGYLVAASARTLRALPAVGQAAALFIETHVREDAIRLYGFLTASERDWFRLLQSVQGVGAKVALGVLGTLTGDAISAAIAHQDKAAMALAPGVGPKLAARIVHELKDKAPALGRRRSRRRDRRRGGVEAAEGRRKTRRWRWSASATAGRRRRSPSPRRSRRSAPRRRPRR